MRSLVVAADAQSGAVTGDSADRTAVTPSAAAGIKGDPQWHAGEDPYPEEACVNSWCCYLRSNGLRRSEHLHAMLKHGEALCAV